ncbi:DoxX family protein [Hymenobacter arizonensis]|uniref:DoxX-like family protein n=1 Tax=Hymenobacter arizonensis TaxID=1227077 RepID=A0A1I5Z418_HYMAR|nr:DoxX family protein [Hymenobacter arizonensis]SFQ51214.1 DoxX-like family protein [Hymenobacter arizonensis]
MNSFSALAQIVVAVSVWFVWTFRFHNVVKEFNHFGLSDLTRSLVGATKVALATLLVVGIWYPALVLIPAVLMGLFMVAAQFFHFKANSPWPKRVPSLVLLLLCVYIASASLNLL